MAITNSDGSIVLTTKVDQSGLKKGMSTMKGGVSSLIGSFGKLATAIGIAFSVGALVKFSKEASNLATTAEASIQRLIDIYGSASQAVGDFIDANAQALGMSRAAAASYASVYGNLFSVWADQKTNAELTNRYLNMTAVVASKTSRTVEDVQERIRSGLLGNTEAIEDLGIFVNVKTIEMTDAFQRMANGKSWEQLDAYAQQQIRTMAILEQATSKYGNEVAQTTALTKSQFHAAWQDFQATWGQVVNRVLIPVLEILTDILVKSTVAMRVLFNISSATISQGNAIEDAKENQDELTNSVKETEKATKKALAGFDDIQILSAGAALNAGTEPVISDTSTGGLLKIEETEKEMSAFEQLSRETFARISKMIQDAWDVSPIKEFWKDTILESLGGEFSWQAVGERMKQTALDMWNSEPIQSFWRAAVSYGTLVLNYWLTIGTNLRENLKSIWNNIEGDLANITSNIVGIWTIFWQDVQLGIDTWGQPIIDGVNGVFNSIWTNAIGPYIQLMVGAWSDFTSILKSKWEEYSQPLIDNIGQFSTNVIDLFQSIYDDVLEPIITPFLQTMSSLWDEHISVMIEKVVDFVMKLVNGALEIYNKFIHPIVMWLTETLEPIFTWIGNHIARVFHNIISMVSDVLGGVFDALGGLIDFIVGIFTGDWEQAWNGIKAFFVGIWDAIWAVVKGVINSIIDVLNYLWGGLYGSLASVVNGVGGIIEGIGSVFGADWDIDIPSNPPIIPKLAQGAVIPPNREFLAVLGDQKQGTNIETPLSTMVEAFNIALNNRQNDTVKEEHYYLDESEIMRLIYKLAKRGERAQGDDLLESW